MVRVQDNQVAFIASCKEFFDLVEASFDAVGTTFAVVTSFAVECKWLIRLVQASGLLIQWKSLMKCGDDACFELN